MLLLSGTRVKANQIPWEHYSLAEPFLLLDTVVPDPADFQLKLSSFVVIPYGHARILAFETTWSR